ncbi:hypothetical protein Glove_87g198 [Diversispora epigaea]|uniref:Uncharacterized protein n=1 Tax=Diversispora epigaea TaxID=1348612 RepID=A0A397JFM7_9GLOM|nr:hypothetical protein Glove_87g198 [Diversispora epigaea]
MILLEIKIWDYVIKWELQKFYALPNDPKEWSEENFKLQNDIIKHSISQMNPCFTGENNYQSWIAFKNNLNSELPSKRRSSSHDILEHASGTIMVAKVAGTDEIACGYIFSFG